MDLDTNQINETLLKGPSSLDILAFKNGLIISGRLPFTSIGDFINRLKELEAMYRDRLEEDAIKAFE